MVTHNTLMFLVLHVPVAQLLSETVPAVARVHRTGNTCTVSKLLHCAYHVVNELLNVMTASVSALAFTTYNNTLD